MRLISQHLFALTSGALLGTACAGGDSGSTQTTGKPVASVVGRLSSDGGNQNVDPGMHPAATGSFGGQINAVSIATLGPAGQLNIIGEGSIAADGTFRIDDVPAGRGPFIVEGQGSAGIVGSVIVPGDLAAGDTVQTVPMSAETTFEANVLASLVASGQGSGQGVTGIDTIGLMTWISANMAADATSTGSVANGVADAQAAWLEVAGAGSAHVTASALVEAKLAAWTELTAALNAAQSESAEATAWTEFMAQAQADVAAQAHVDLATQAEATAAAGVLFQAAFADGSAASDDATAIAAVLSAHADWQTQAGATSGSAAISGQLDLAYQAFLGAVASATNVDGVGIAYVNLAAAISGTGSSDASGSIAASLAAQAESHVTFGNMQAAIEAAAQASVDLRVSLGTALASGARETRVSGVVQSYAAFEAAVQAAVEAHLGAGAPDWATSFVASAAAEAGGHGAVLLDLDILSVVTGGDTGIDLVGSITASLGFQSGADGMSDVVFTASADAATAVLVTLNAQGEAQTVATGSIDASGLIHFDGVTATTSSATFVEVLDGGGQVVGAVQLDGVLSSSGGDVTAPPMTAETTAEAQVFIQLVADGAAETSIDRAFLEAHIDAAMAGAMQSDSDVATVATAIAIAAEVHAQALGTTTTALQNASASTLAQLHADLSANSQGATEAYADFQSAVAAAVAGTAGADASEQSWAEAEAAASMTAVITGSAGAGSDLAATSEARAHLEASAALASAVSAAFSGASFGASHTGEIQAAVSAYASAIGSAQNQDQLDMAGDAFVAAMLGLGGLGTNASGVLGVVVSTDLHLGALDQASIAAALQSSFQAASTWEAAINAAVSLTGSGSGSGSGSLDVHTTVAAIATASSTFDGALSAALDLSALASLQGQDGAALRELVVQLSAGLYGSASGSTASP